jgi:uncharacterized membrane protein
MNRQQFLAELNQYLTFFSPEERANVIAAYNQRFDTAGPDCEAALIAELDTPMRTAIDLKRRLEAGEKISFAENCACGEKPEEDPLSAYNVETETEETLNADTAEAPTEAEATAEASAEAVPEATPETKAAPSDEGVKKPSGGKFIFALIGSALLSVVIAAFFLVIAAMGVGLLVAMSYLMIAGFQSFVYLTDALLLFGGGLVCLGLGLLIIWFALWAAIRLIVGLFQSASRVGLRDTGKERDA